MVAQTDDLRLLGREGARRQHATHEPKQPDVIKTSIFSLPSETSYSTTLSTLCHLAGLLAYIGCLYIAAVLCILAGSILLLLLLLCYL